MITKLNPGQHIKRIDVWKKITNGETNNHDVKWYVKLLTGQGNEN